MKLRVGLTGGIGSGKSEVARILRDLGALVIDADELAREAIAPGSAALALIAERWPGVVRDGVLDRAALAGVVFAQPQEREALNAIVHPLVRDLQRVRESEARPEQVVVHAVPLLYESGLAASFDAVIVVAAPTETRFARLEARGASREDAARRMRAQLDPAQARGRADYVIENDGTLAQLRERTEAAFRQLEERPPRGTPI